MSYEWRRNMVKHLQRQANIRQRAWYYTKVFVDPKNEKTKFIALMLVSCVVWRGKTFQSLNTPHGDHHDLWIDPEPMANRMIAADDGGAQVSFDGGNNWSTYLNPAQRYRYIV